MESFFGTDTQSVQTGTGVTPLGARPYGGIGFRKYKQQSPHEAGFVVFWDLTMTYFRIRTHTIIGAKSFHGPVRDGKVWDQLAMIVRITCRLICTCRKPAHAEKANLEEVR